MRDGGHLTQPRRMAKIIATATVVTALALTASTASAGTINGADGSVSGINSLTSVACPTAKACVAVGLAPDGSTGKSAVINATTGAAKAWSGGLTDDPLNAVACPAGTASCLTVADDAVAKLTDATGAMKVTATPKPPSGGIMAIGAIACASSKTCYAVGFQGTPGASNAVLFHLSAAGKVVHKTTGTGKGMGTIACPAITRCLLSDNEASGLAIQVLNGGKLGKSNPVPANTYIQRIACYKASLCYALGGSTAGSVTDELFPVNPTTGALGSMITISGFSGTGMTCISATTCLVVGYTGLGSTAKPAAVTVTNGSPGTPVDYPGEGLTSIACATASLCYAVGLGKTAAIVDKVKP
jgi:hypothetical protein